MSSETVPGRQMDTARHSVTYQLRRTIHPPPPHPPNHRGYITPAGIGPPDSPRLFPPLQHGVRKHGPARRHRSLGPVT